MLRDTMLVFQRSMMQSLRQPAWVAIGLLQPVLYLTLFAPLLQSIVSTPGFPPGDAWQIFVPALLVQQALFGSLFVGFGLIGEYRAGVIERMRVTPASRFSLLLGRVLRDVVVLFVQALILLGLGTVFGLRAPIGGALFGLLLVLLLGTFASSLSYSLALRLKSEDAFAPLLNMMVLPLLLLSGILLPMSVAPTWLQWISTINPFRHVVDAERAVFLGDFADTSVLVGSGFAIAAIIVGVAFGVRTFQRESA